MAEAPRDAGTTPRLSVDDTRGIATLTLARPAHRNRLHGEDLQALQAHFAALAARDDVRVLVLAAEGPVFCAGYHLGELEVPAAGDALPGPAMFERTVDMLESLPLPTVARLHGAAHGGATDLVLACDWRIGVTTMTLRMPAARLGLHYYASGLQRAVARLGPGAAKRLFLLAEPVDAAELLRLGVLDALVAPEALDEAVARAADALAAGAPLAVRGMKQSIDEIAQGRADTARLRERERRCAASADLREGLAAFAERRTPRFTGR
jgi:enoyl-CoA hydratase/carnithine racemase